jgi:hypothetical protein
LGQTLPFEVWERIRRSLELAQSQYLPPNPAVPNNALLERFMWSSCSSAWNSNNYLLSWELAQMLKARNSIFTTDFTPELAAAFQYFGAIGAFAKSLAWQPEVRRVIAHPLPDYLQGMIIDALTKSVSPSVQVETRDGPASADVPGDAVLLVASESERERLIDQGVPPGLVSSLEGLREVFIFMPPPAA